jgi:hypothetical protein
MCIFAVPKTTTYLTVECIYFDFEKAAPFYSFEGVSEHLFT